MSLYWSVCLIVQIFSIILHLLFLNILDLVSGLSMVYHIRWFIMTVLIFILLVYFLLDFFVILQLILLLLNWKIRIHFWQIKKWNTWPTLLIWWLCFQSLNCFLSWFILWKTSLNLIMIDWLVVILFYIGWISTVVSVEFICHANIALSFHINLWLWLRSNLFRGH